MENILNELPGYKQAVNLLSNEQLKKAAEHFYEFLAGNKIPEEVTSFGGSFGSFWAHLIRLRAKFLDGYRLETEQCARQQFDKELRELNVNAPVQNPHNPFEDYRDFIDKCGSLGENNAKEFRVSYLNPKVASGIRAFAIKFSDTSPMRRQSSQENGQKGGRPRSEDASDQALYKREYRERKKLTNTNPTGFVN